jgi:hypothetical protein
VLANVMTQVTTLVARRSAPPPLAAPVPIEMGSGERARYAATYGSGTGYLTLTLSNSPSGLHLRQLGSTDSSRVEKIAVDAFLSDGTYFALSRGADGSAEYLHIAGHTLRRVRAGRRSPAVH